jgi:hypothetical protein
MPTDVHGTRASSVTRRAFVRAGGLLALGLALPGEALGRARSGAHRIRTGAWHYRSSYHPLVGQRFTVRGSNVKLQLVAVKDLNTHQAGSENAFALTFDATPGGAPLPAPLPLLHHHALGHFHLFMTPGLSMPGVQSYTAVINRLHA